MPEYRSVAGYRRDLKQGSGNIHESTRAARNFPEDARTGRRSYRGRLYAFSETSPGKSGPIGAVLLATRALIIRRSKMRFTSCCRHSKSGRRNIDNKLSMRTL